MVTQHLTQSQIHTMLGDIAMTAESARCLCQAVTMDVDDPQTAATVQAVAYLIERIGFIADKAGAGCFGDWERWFMSPNFQPAEAE
jgi:hypothetical protein